MKSDFASSFRSSNVQIRRRRRQRLWVFGTVGTLGFILLVAIVAVKANASEKISPPPEFSPEDRVNLGTAVLYVPVAQAPQGAKLDSIQLREEYWPRDKVPLGAVRNLEEIKEMYAKIVLHAGEPIRREDFQATPDMDNNISGKICRGCRAVTLEVDAMSSVEGHVTPGSHVDVMLTYLDSSNGQNTTRLVVENAEVISLGGSSRRENEGEPRPLAPKSSTTVTLATPLRNTMEILTAKTLGRISLVLRNQDFQETIAPRDRIVTQRDLEGREKEKPKDVPVFVPQTNAKDGKCEFFVDPHNRIVKTCQLDG